MRRTLLLVGFLTVIGASIYGTHIVDGGYYYDDWRSVARSPAVIPGGLGESIEINMTKEGFRPVSALYRALLWGSPIGLHMGWNLGIALIWAIVFSTLLHRLLRELDMATWDATAITALVLIYPHADSTRLWVSGNTILVNGSIVIVGQLVALHGLRSERVRSQVGWHALAVSLFLLAVFFSETAAPLIVLTGVLYAWRGTWRQAVLRSAVDVVVVCAAALYMLSNTIIPASPRTVEALASRVKQITTQAMDLLSITAFPPAGPQRWIVVVMAIIAVIAAVGCVMPRWRSSDWRARLIPWIATCGAGLLIAAAAYSVYVPADPYYGPMLLGVGNRVNGIAAVGLILITYGTIRLATEIACCRIRRASDCAIAVTLLAACGVGAGYAHETRNNAADWDRAYLAQTHILALVNERIPDPEDETHIFTYAHPLWQALGVPIFAAPWDLNGAVRFIYRNETLRGTPLNPEASLACGRLGLSPTGVGTEDIDVTPYGKAAFLSVDQQQVFHVGSRADCDAMNSRLEAGRHVPAVAS